MSKKDKNTTTEIVVLVNEYLLFDADGEHEYTIKIEDITDATRYSIFASYSSLWFENIKGSKMFSFTDNGNTIEFEKSLKSLDYSELEYIRLLTTIHNHADENDANKSKYRVIEVVKEFNL
jgi:hypothetical protein